ncbi:MAG: Flp pilus assembly protein CpaB [Candidatus Omnitrophota bacterium]
MPIDFKKLDKTKLMVLVAAVAAGIIAVVLTNAHITRTIEEGSSSEQVAYLMEKVKGLEQANQEVLQKQAAYANRIEQTIQKLSQGQQSNAPRPAEEKPEIRKQSLALRTPAGKRAITVNITTLSAVGGLLNPGDFVDVLVHLALPVDSVVVTDSSAQKAAQTQKTTVTLFQNVQILAIGSNVDSPADFEGQQKTAKLSITFAVDPQQAELMTFADSHGSLQLVLRSTGERSAYRLPSANWDTFKEYLEAAEGITINSPVVKRAEKPKEPPAPEIKVYRGGSK